MTLYPLPDLPDVPRARAFADRLRGLDDARAAELLTTSEGAWFYTDALPYTDGETRLRVLKLVVGRVPPGPLERSAPNLARHRGAPSWEAGKLKDSEVRATVAQTSPRVDLAHVGGR